MIKLLGITFVLFAGLIFIGLFLKYRMKNTVDHRNLEAELDSELAQWLKRGLAPGLVIGVYKDGKTYIKGYGYIDKVSNITPTGETLFEIASITKLFTAAALQIICDRPASGIGLDTRLNEILTNVKLSPAVENITLRQLATHSSGLPSFPKEYLKTAKDTNNISRDFTINALYTYLENPLEIRRSGKFVYSNLAFGLLGHLLEKVTRKSYQHVVTETLLEPLAMTDTCVVMPDFTQVAQGYTLRGEPAALLDWAGGALNGAGALKSNVKDMMRFVRANLESDNTPIMQSLRKMHSPQLNDKTGLGWMLPMMIDRFSVTMRFFGTMA